MQDAWGLEVKQPDVSEMVDWFLSATGITEVTKGDMEMAQGIVKVNMMEVTGQEGFGVRI